MPDPLVSALPPEVPEESEGVYYQDVETRVRALLDNAERTLAANDLPPLLREKYARNEVRLVLELLEEADIEPEVHSWALEEIKRLGMEG